MWCRAICSRLTVLGSTLLAACSLAGSAAYAQRRDEAWVIAQIMSGKLDDLRALEKLSDESVPFAMYWWGTLLHHCVFEICDRAAAQALFLRAAKAGHARAQAAVFAVPTSPGEFAKLTAEVGVPKDGYARLIYGIQALLVTGPRHSGPFIPADLLRTDPKARADFVALATSERQLWLLVVLVELEGKLARADEVRAVANSGYVLASETVIRGTTGLQMLERVRAGELWLGAAYCDTAARDRGQYILPSEILSVCERAAGQGFPGGVRALLRHHHHTKNQRAAEYFAGVCDALLGLDCAEDLDAYYHDRRDESADLRAKWELWNRSRSGKALIAEPLRENLGQPVIVENVARDKHEGLRRSLFMLGVRTDLIYEACMTQRLDVKTGAREADPECPWRVPIAIPAEFLSGAR
jgi:hypothetical protein